MSRTGVSLPLSARLNSFERYRERYFLCARVLRKKYDCNPKKTKSSTFLPSVIVAAVNARLRLQISTSVNLYYFILEI